MHIALTGPYTLGFVVYSFFGMTIVQSDSSRQLANLLSSMPMRKPASASPARKLPLPASLPVTAYSLTNT